MLEFITTVVSTWIQMLWLSLAGVVAGVILHRLQLKIKQDQRPWTVK